jgi:hypothetical protein
VIGWISGPSVSPEDIEQVRAGDVQTGDRLLHDGHLSEVTDTRLGIYRFPEGSASGVSIGWKAGNASGLLFRRASDLLERITSQP